MPIGTKDLLLPGAGLATGKIGDFNPGSSLGLNLPSAGDLTQSFTDDLLGRAKGAPITSPAGDRSLSALERQRANALALQQQSFADRLRQQMDGKGPSLASQQMADSVGRAQQAQRSMAASARGGGYSQMLANRMAANNMAQLSSQGATDAARLRMQEQQAATAQLGNQLYMQRQQELNSRQIGVREAQGNQDSSLMAQKYESDRLNGKQGGVTGMVTGILGALSDERSKVETGSVDPSEALAGVGNHRYQYRDPSDPPGEYAGPHAQELAGSSDPAIRNLVFEGEDGRLRVDTGRAGATALGIVADQQRKIDSLEARLSSLMGGR